MPHLSCVPGFRPISASSPHKVSAYRYKNESKFVTQHNIPTLNPGLTRRGLLRAGASGLAAIGTPLWAQGARSAPARGITIAQIADMSAAQIDVSKDFLIGARAAWADINAKGGVRGLPVQHLVLETDGSAASLAKAIDTIQGLPHCVAAFGTVGSQAAAMASTQLQRSLPDLAHMAPWLHSTESSLPDNSFPIFASRTDQIQHALKSLSSMGVDQVGVIFGSPHDRQASLPEIERLTRNMALRPLVYPQHSEMQQLGASLHADSPRVLLFIGATPELLALTQGIARQAQQRYIIALADVNVLTLQQSGLSRHSAVIATQVVPLVNAQAPVVRQYREAMARLYDEPPTPQSLSGFVAARFAFEALRQTEGTPTRMGVMAALQQRKSWDLGGFLIQTSAQRRSGSYVTQSMLASDGRFVG